MKQEIRLWPVQKLILFETLVQKEILLSHGLRLIYPSRKPGASPCKSLLLAAGAGVPKPPKSRVLKAREAQNGGFGTGQGRGRARAAGGQQHGQQQRQEFQNHKKSLFKGAGSSKWWFWNWSGQGQGRGSSGQQHGQQQGQQQGQDLLYGR